MLWRCSALNVSVRTLVAEASKQGVQFVCFPETFAYLGYQGTNPVTGDNNITKKPGLSEPLSGPLFTRYQHLAKEFNIWISYGGFQETSHVENKTFNAHVIVKPDGEIADVYRKVHLFDCPYAALFESRNYVAGDDIKVIDTPFGRIGLAICYDLRFSAHFEAMRSLGVEIILIPAAFTKKTGIAHWHILQRARAIETQCYVISAAQGGVHNPKRESFGHALIIDPFGRVLADIEEGVGLAVAEIDLEYLDQVRREIPTSQHRRFDVYAKYDTAKQ